MPRIPTGDNNPTVPLTVRFEADILWRLKAMAFHERRSLNEEILFYLNEAADRFEIDHPGWEPEQYAGEFLDYVSTLRSKK